MRIARIAGLIGFAVLWLLAMWLVDEHPDKAAFLLGWGAYGILLLIWIEVMQRGGKQ